MSPRKPLSPAADLFASDASATMQNQTLGDGALILRGAALEAAPSLLQAVEAIAAQAPPRQLTVPGGKRMSVAMTNTGALGWVSDTRGYRYEPCDPASGQPWPAMPDVLRQLARKAAADAGYAGFVPDACLINFYAPGARMSLHRDHDEGDLSAPIVSVSLGLPATFLWGGRVRSDKPQRVRLQHGDIVVWGGASRLVYHGVAPLADGEHADCGRWRINLTFRKAV